MLDVPRTEHVTIGGRAFSSTAAHVRAFLQLTLHLSNDFTAARFVANKLMMMMMTHFPAAFCCGPAAL